MAKWRLPKAAEELHDDRCACECRQGAFLHSKLLSTPLQVRLCHANNPRKTHYKEFLRTAGVFWTDPYSVCHGVDKQCLHPHLWWCMACTAIENRFAPQC